MHICMCLRADSVFWCDVHSVQSVSVDGSARIVHVMSPANNFVALSLHLVIFTVLFTLSLFRGKGPGVAGKFLRYNAEIYTFSVRFGRQKLAISVPVLCFCTYLCITYCLLCVQGTVHRLRYWDNRRRCRGLLNTFLSVLQCETAAIMACPALLSIYLKKT